jgi:prefoldin subunit 5
MDNFRKAGFKPKIPFTQDQVAYLEDIFTSSIMYLDLQIHDLDRFKIKLNTALQEIRSMKDANSTPP